MLFCEIAKVPLLIEIVILVHLSRNVVGRILRNPGLEELFLIMLVLNFAERLIARQGVRMILVRKIESPIV